MASPSARTASDMKGEIGTTAICEMCGNEYTVTGTRQKYCLACSSIRRREAGAASFHRKITGTSRKIGSAAICECCGSEYTTTGGNQKFCPSCARSHWGRGEHRHIGSAATCKRCGESFILTATGQRYCPACAALKRSPRVDDSLLDLAAFSALLKKHSITQADFSRRFCISSALISRWCSGERRCPTYVLSMADELLTIDAEKRKNQKEEST
jgi:uncharacterized Zn ribbon protein